MVAAKSYQQRVSSAGMRESSHPRETSGASQRQSQLGSTTHVAGAGMADDNHALYVPCVLVNTSIAFIVTCVDIMYTYLIFAGRNAGIELRNQRTSTPTHIGAKIDHSVVFQALKELLSPRFDGPVSLFVLQYMCEC